MDLAIRCRDLHKTYDAKPPVHAVRGLDLEVRAGECFGLLGPNGAGKTTTVEIFEGLIEPSSGDVEVLGRRWKTDAAELRQRLGVSLQETRLADKLTVGEVVRMFSSFFRRGRPADEVIAEVGLGEKTGAYTANLSGGQRQRLAVACALVGDPELLFLDEPTTGLDPQSRRQLWEVVRELQHRGRTIVLTTHYMDEAEKLCDRVAVVDHGRVIALGSPAELIASLGGDHVVEFAVGADDAPRADAPRAGAPRAGAPPDGNGAGPPFAPEALTALPSVQAARFEAGAYQLSVAQPHVTIPALLEHLTGRGLPLSRLTTRQASLEDVFVHLTGRHLRDE